MSDDAYEMQDELDARVPELKTLLNKPTYNELEAKLATIAAWYERNRLRLFDVNDDELEALLTKEQSDE